MKAHIISAMILLVCGLASPAHSLSSSPQSRPLTQDSTSRALQIEIDSLRLQLRDWSHDPNRDYTAILEKTNQQLNLWLNPYGILIASLAVLFTILAIAATAMIYLQSKEYRERLNAFVKGYQNILDKLVSEWNKRLTDLDKQIQDYQSKLATATGENKKTIEQEIAKLRTQKDSVSSQIASTVVAVPAWTNPFGIVKRHHNCSKCGWGFLVQTPSPFFAMAAGAGSGDLTAKCPKCGNIDKIQIT